MGISAFGSLLKIGDGGTPEAFTTIAECYDISGPSLALDAIEITHHTSTDGWREFVGGLLDGGEVTLSINFDPVGATHGYSSGLVEDMVNRTKRNFQLVFPDPGTTTWAFTALVTGFEVKAPIDDRLSSDVTLKISGKPTLE